MKRISQFLGGFVSLIILWWLMSYLLDNRSLPTPWLTFERMTELGFDMWRHTAASALRILTALSLALVFGVPLGILWGVSNYFNRLFGPLIYLLYPIPKVAFLPIFMIFWGLGNTSKIMLIFSVIIIQVIVSIRDAVQSIPHNYFELMANYKSNFKHQLRFLIIPAILPAIISSLRVSIGIGLASLFFAENYSTKYGLGYLILSAWSKMDYPQMLAGILLISLLGYLFFQLLDILEMKLKH
ncbi:ABC transporter permease subunit [Aerococcaceae bacterium WS4759]|uniref:ABC transporter permease subunit n=1 Tax=Fundicoccus ignavus TaxID=2664442 RepID=A0A6I2GY43_9LACT|nr:ABC transporter permease subunit [Fundicoccus ignavus]MRI85313.1 ABC transporter permease subunit [Fundicoccus ignavus]